MNVLKIEDVVEKTKIGRSTIYAKMKIGEFPKQIKLGIKASGLFENEVNEWLSSRRVNSWEN